MARKAYEAYGKSSPLPPLLRFPFPPAYVPPPVSISTRGSRRGTLTTWVRRGDYPHVKEVIPSYSPDTGLCASHCARTVLASCSLPLWEQDGRGCAEKNRRATPPPAHPTAPPKTPSDGSGEKEAPGRPAGAPAARA